jgi:hypothetical protein
MKGCAAIFAGLLGLMSLATSAPGAVALGSAVRVGDQLQFTVTGESNASYIIEGSTNLQQWRGVLTNREATVTRTLSVGLNSSRNYYRARVARPFMGTLAASGFIDLKGHNMLSDSFDSSSTNASTAGRYDETKRRDNGDVAAYSGLTNSVNIGNARFYGSLWIGPGGSVMIGPQGAVGSSAYVDNPANNGTIEPGWLREEAAASYPHAILPLSLTSGLSPPSGTVAGTNYNYVLGNANYRMPHLSMSGGSPGTSTMIVTGRAALFVAGVIDMSGQARIVIAPGGSLTMYVAGPTANIGGGGIINQTHRALGFQYYGLPSNTSVNLTGNGNFIGTIYASNADLRLTGGAEDFSGAIVSRTTTLNTTYYFHYDEDLARAGPVF